MEINSGNMKNTATQYQMVLTQCKSIFLDKTRDYGTSWRVLRPISITDQLFIKANRIRTIQEKGINKVGDGIASEFQAIVNYGIIALIQLQLSSEQPFENLPLEKAATLYDGQVQVVRQIMEAKNHDYGEAWRDMSLESFVDLILTKILRIKQIHRNEGQTVASEGIDSNLVDITNYAIFALIQLSETKS
jgi:hypothetical protein